MALTKKQSMDERDAILLDLFGKQTINVKTHIESLPQSEKEILTDKINKHISFFGKIANEEFSESKESFRIEVAKLRANQIYPQLLKLL